VPVLVDSSVWVDHFRRRNIRLVAALEAVQVLVHPFVIGELRCGNLARRDEILGLLQSLPSSPLIEHPEVLEFVAARRLYGRGLGWVDMHLLASARLARVPLWTLDKRLAAAAADLGVAAGEAG
jgi:predicted nucleic acid-binding protein